MINFTKSNKEKCFMVETTEEDYGIHKFDEFRKVHTIRGRLWVFWAYLQLVYMMSKPTWIMKRAGLYPNVKYCLNKNK